MSAPENCHDCPLGLIESCGMHDYKNKKIVPREPCPFVLLDAANKRIIQLEIQNMKLERWCELKELNPKGE
jgi:hypothetical protein